MKLHNRERPGLEDIALSPLEVCLINWATPLEYPIALGLRLFKRDEFARDPYFQNGAWRGLVDSKTADYRRLIRAGSENQEMNSAVLEVYGRYLCGRVMLATYHSFHKG